jgi:hypothetical protein
MIRTDPDSTGTSPSAARASVDFPHPLSQTDRLTIGYLQVDVVHRTEAAPIAAGERDRHALDRQHWGRRLVGSCGVDGCLVLI